MKTSAVVCNRDELYLRESIMSIQGFVDEIILVDASKQFNKKIIDEIKNNIQCDFTILRMKPCIYKQLDQGIKHSKHPVILRWDSDFIGNDQISELIEIIRSKTGYFALSFYVNNMYYKGNKKMEKLHSEYYVFRKSRYMQKRKRLGRKILITLRLLFGGIKPRFTFFPIPFWYKRYHIDKVYVDHVNQKHPFRNTERKYQPFWQNLSDDERRDYGTFENYVALQEADGGEGFDWKFKKLPYKKEN